MGWAMRLLIVTLALALLTIPAAHAEKRVALVIGNAAYKNAATLQNPRNDAQDVKAALQRLGFETIVGLDLDDAGMKEKSIAFARAARDADVALVYYSGHAMQFGGSNYLMPVDAALHDQADLRRLVRVDDIVADLKQAKNLRILVLDACRVNPLAEELSRSMELTRSPPVDRGLARITAARGMIISYATQAGQTAADGQGRNSPYTMAFLKNIETTHEISTIFRHITADVDTATQSKQLPELSLSVVGDFYLKGRPQMTGDAPPTSPSPQSTSEAERAWAATQGTTSQAVLESFIGRYGDSFYGDLARARLEELTKGQVAVVAPVPTTSTSPSAGTSHVAAVAPPPIAPGSQDNTQRLVRSFIGHTDEVNSVAFSPEGRFALSGGDNTLKLWDVASGSELRAFTGHTSLVRSVAFSPDGRFALSGGGDKTIKLWEIASGKELRSFTGHKDTVRSVALSPDGQFVLSGSCDEEKIEQSSSPFPVCVRGSLKLWEVGSGRERRSFNGHTETVTSVAFSPDGLFALSGSNDKTLKLWEVTSGRKLRSFSGHTDIIYSVAFSPDGRFALSGSADNTLKLWDVASGSELRTFTGHTWGVASVAFSPDGRFALSGGGDKTIKLWEVASGKELRSFTGDTSKVSSVAFSPDGRFAISGGGDKTLKLWDMSEWTQPSQSRR
jgi:WD40 repeat protein/uncharacterized caspase-like protein